MKPTREIKGTVFQAEVLNSKWPVLVAFTTPWSRPCKVFEVTLKVVAAACEPHVKVVQINADDYPELSLWFDIQSIPTLLYFLAGRVRDRVVGTASKEAILSKLSSIQEAV
jgi:thioredoxin-like negative regulator of GroEL